MIRTFTDIEVIEVVIDEVFVLNIVALILRTLPRIANHSFQLMVFQREDVVAKPLQTVCPPLFVLDVSCTSECTLVRVFGSAGFVVVALEVVVLQCVAD